MLDANFSFRWLAAAARHRFVWLGLPLAMHAWALAGPFVFDDLYLLRTTEEYISGARPTLDLFRFAPDHDAWMRLRGDGDYPWYAPDERRIDFFRPLPEWLFYLDVRLFGRNPAGHRAMSMAWFAAALICAHRLYHRATGDAVIAGTAAFLLGISQSLAAPVTFICNRSDLVVIVGVCLAATAYIAPSGTSAGRLALAIGGFALALVSKESAVALAAVLVVDQALRRRQAADAPRDRTCVYITAACALLAAAYLAYYASTRWDALSTAGGDNAAQRVLSALGLYSAVWSIGFPASLLLHESHERILVVTLAGAGVMLMALPHLFRLRLHEPRARFFGLWTIFFLMPALLVAPESRALSVAGVGWIFLLTCLIVPREPAPNIAPLWLRHLLLTANGVLAAGCGIGTAWYMFQAELQCRASLLQHVASRHEPIADGDVLVVARAGSPFELIAAGARLEYLLNLRDARAIFLTLTGSDAQFARLKDRQLRVWSTGTPLLNSPAHRLTLGAGLRPSVGQIFQLRGVSILIEALHPQGGVSRFTATFDEPFSSGSVHLCPPATFADVAAQSIAPARLTPAEARR